MIALNRMNTPDKPYKVSIIIPVHNSVETIEETIQSALRQTWPSKEIIVIDDGSTDNSVEVVQKYLSEQVRLTCVRQGGAARARNLGLQLASGEFIQYLDADDLMADNKLEVQMNRILSQPEPHSVVTACRWLRFAGDLSNPIGGTGPGGKAEFDLSPADWLVMRPYNLQLLHGWLTPRRLIEQAGPWDELMTLDDDGEFFTRVVSRASRVLFCRETIAYYRMSLSSPTLSFYSKFDPDQSNCAKLESSLRSAHTFKRVMETFDHPEGRTAVGRTYLYLAYSSYLVCENVYRESVGQREVPRIQRVSIYRLVGGRLGLLYLLVGWRLGKKLMMTWKLR